MHEHVYQYMHLSSLTMNNTSSVFFDSLLNRALMTDLYFTQDSHLLPLTIQVCHMIEFAELLCMLPRSAPLVSYCR